MKRHSYPTGLLLFTIATLGEFAALFYWRELITADRTLLAIIALGTGFVIERSAVVVWLRLPPSLPDPSGRVRSLWAILLMVTLAEIAIWILWLHLSAAAGLILATAFLASAIHLVHSYEVAVIRSGRWPPAMRDGGTITLSVVEAAGGAGWLYFVDHGRPGVGAAVLLGSLLVEHILQVTGLRIADNTRSGTGVA